MEKMQKTAKTIDTIMKILFWIVLVGLVLAVVAEIALALGGGSLITNAFSGTVTVNGTELDLSGYPEFKPMLRSTALRIVSAAVFSLAVCLVGLVVFRKIIRPMKSGMPFEGSVSKRFKELGLLTIIYGVADNIFGILADASANKLALQLARQGIINDFSSTSFTLKLTPFLAALVIYLFSYIFAYGEQLQAKSDEAAEA